MAWLPEYVRFDIQTRSEQCICCWLQLLQYHRAIDYFGRCLTFIATVVKALWQKKCIYYLPGINCCVHFTIFCRQTGPNWMDVRHQYSEERSLCTHHSSFVGHDGRCR